MNTWILMTLECAMHLVEVQGRVYRVIICVMIVMVMRIIESFIRASDFFILPHHKGRSITWYKSWLHFHMSTSSPYMILIICLEEFRLPCLYLRPKSLLKSCSRISVINYMSKINVGIELADWLPYFLANL